MATTCPPKKLIVNEEIKRNAWKEKLNHLFYFVRRVIPRRMASWKHYIYLFVGRTKNEWKLKSKWKQEYEDKRKSYNYVAMANSVNYYSIFLSALQKPIPKVCMRGRCKFTSIHTHIHKDRMYLLGIRFNDQWFIVWVQIILQM